MFDKKRASLLANGSSCCFVVVFAKSTSFIVQQSFCNQDKKLCSVPYLTILLLGLCTRYIYLRKK